jgi:hypothetical protein
VARPPFGEEKEYTTCDDCGDTVTLPPGVIHEGLKLHKHCAQIRRQQDRSNDVVEPFLDRIEQELDELMENMEPMETPDWPY